MLLELGNTDKWKEVLIVLVNNLGLIYSIIYDIRVMLRIYLVTQEQSVKRGVILMMISLVYLTIAFSTQTHFSPSSHFISSSSINFAILEA